MKAVILCGNKVDICNPICYIAIRVTCVDFKFSGKFVGAASEDGDTADQGDGS